LKKQSRGLLDRSRGFLERLYNKFASQSFHSILAGGSVGAFVQVILEIKAICGRGYSGSAFVGETSFAQRVINGAWACFQSAAWDGTAPAFRRTRAAVRMLSGFFIIVGFLFG
jgi:hypothetical protein